MSIISHEQLQQARIENLEARLKAANAELIQAKIEAQQYRAATDAKLQGMLDRLRVLMDKCTLEEQLQLSVEIFASRP